MTLRYTCGCLCSHRWRGGQRHSHERALGGHDGETCGSRRPLEHGLLRSDGRIDDVGFEEVRRIKEGGELEWSERERKVVAFVQDGEQQRRNGK